MAERTDLTTLPRIKNGGGPKYEQYLDGAIWRLTLGVDTKCSTTDSLRAVLHTSGKRLGLKVHVRRESDTTVLVQAVPR